MFVSIDMDRLVFLHKHQDHETVSAISWLECGQLTSIRVEPYHDRSRFLGNVSDLDVRMLYKNTTGQPLAREADSTAIRYQLADAVQLMPSTRVLTHEVLAQVDAVDDRLHLGERFKYALGAKAPAQPVELFPLKGRPLTAQELATAESHSRNPVPGYPPRLSGEPRKPWEPELPVHAPVAQAAPTGIPPVPPVPAAPTAGKARTGSVKPVVYGAATRAWEEAGKGTKATWEQVRKTLITELEAQGFHPTTIRIKLSEWAKANAI